MGTFPSTGETTALVDVVGVVVVTDLPVADAVALWCDVVVVAVEVATVGFISNVDRRWIRTTG